MSKIATAAFLLAIFRKHSLKKKTESIQLTTVTSFGVAKGFIFTCHQLQTY